MVRLTFPWKQPIKEEAPVNSYFKRVLFLLAIALAACADSGIAVYTGDSGIDEGEDAAVSACVFNSGLDGDCDDTIQFGVIGAEEEVTRYVRFDANDDLTIDAVVTDVESDLLTIEPKVSSSGSLEDIELPQALQRSGSIFVKLVLTATDEDALGGNLYTAARRAHSR